MMLKHWIGLFALLTLAAMPVLAQDATAVPPEDAHEQQWIMEMIDTVEVVEQDGQPALLIAGVLTGTCEPVDRTEVTREGVALFVDLFRTLNPAIRCLVAETPYEITVPVPELLELDDDNTLPQYLIVNDKTYQISIAQIEPVGNPPAVPPTMLNDVRRSDLPVDEVTWTAQDDGYLLDVKGHYPDGCTDPVIARVRPDLADASHYFLDVFNLLPVDMMCPLTAVAVPFEFSVTMEKPASLPVTVTAGHQVMSLMPEFEITDGSDSGSDEDATFRSPHVIDTVDILIRESAPPQYVVHVEGYQSDGCEYPVTVTQTREGSTIKIEIYREMPLAVACPMIVLEYKADIVLEGTFEPGDYNVDVNGITDTFQAQ